MQPASYAAGIRLPYEDLPAEVRQLSFDTVWRLLVALAGAMHSMSSRPDPTGLPTIRGWQATTGDTLLQWCQREAPVGWPG